MEVLPCMEEVDENKYYEGMCSNYKQQVILS
jgi:hypothetical protein